MPSRFWVIGGEYQDTAFRDLVPGTEEEVLGPFDDYTHAFEAWKAKAWSSVDTATRRFRIQEERREARHRRFFVVGGDYIDTNFRNLAEGASEERYGPFETYEDAYHAWQERAWSSVDSCTKRYRVVEEVGT